MATANQTYLPLTQSQFLLWTGQQFNPNTPLYNVPYAFEVSGVIDITIFNRAFQELIFTTDALRTIFETYEGTPQQRILPAYTYELPLIDFSTSTKQDIDQWIQEQSECLFDFSKPLFNTAILKIDTKRYIWFLNVHHLITDAQSSTLLFEKMSEYYSALKNNTPIPNDDHRFSYAKYIDYEIKQRNDSAQTFISDYWKSKVKEITETPVLYGNKKKQSTTLSSRVSISLGKTRSEQLREIAKHPEVRLWTTQMSLFSIFTTLVLILVYRISGQKKIAIGAPIHNRTTPVFKKTVGLFVELFPLIDELSEEDTFYSVLQRVKTEGNSYLKYATTGMSSAETSRSFTTVLNYIHATFPDFDGQPATSTWIHPNHCDPAHHLRCHVYDMDATGVFDIVFDLNQDIFPNTIRQYVPQHFLMVLDAFLTDMSMPIGQPSLVTPEEITAITVPAVSESKASTFTSILDGFEAAVRNYPNSVALQYNKTTLTYTQLNTKVNQLAHYLHEQDLGVYPRIALYLYRSPEYIISILAIMKIGGTFIPIASNQPIARIGFMVNNSDCALLLTEGHLQNKLKDISIPVIDLIGIPSIWNTQHDAYSAKPFDATALAYLLYTSGSTGNPKGVLISNKALSNYILWAQTHYNIDHTAIFPLCTSISFDLTITATFLPLISGGTLIVYREPSFGPDISILQVLGEGRVNTIKLTPSHLTLFQDRNTIPSAIRTMIIGGEDFKTHLAKSIQLAFGNEVTIYNEYGPTETTVGCIVSTYNSSKHQQASVPIGRPITGMYAYVLDDFLNIVPQGVIGALYLSGDGLANGYAKLPELTNHKFIANPFVPGTKMYQTGDLVRLNTDGDFEYFGRIDEQVKLRGYRIELSDIESNIIEYPEVDNCAVVLIKDQEFIPETEVINCTKCGLPSNYPNVDFDALGVCHLCNAFKGYKHKAERYFKTESELKRILTTPRDHPGTYDCLSLLSGGKDSTYILARLVGMGLKVLAFTLDNGYISEQAKANINRVVKTLRVDHIYGSTAHMNAIFVDSLQRHKNVCDGCFKTIYTLSTKVAFEKQIPFIVTGLSRGQFFETRLTEELFRDEDLDITKIDDTILAARKLYHKESDAVKELLDVSLFEDNTVFETVQFIDFYRYCDVSLEDMLHFLEKQVNWVRPTDTGRSTNCLINQVGIYVHKKQNGYSNYSFPYSWDVRLGHKTRQESLDEINEIINETEVKRIMNEIGYLDTDYSWKTQEQLVGYYTGKSPIPTKDLKVFMAKKVPPYMMPSIFKYIDEIPLTANGKVDKKTLQSLNAVQLNMDTIFTAPRNEIESLVADIWKEVLLIKKVGVFDDFIALGGHSLAAIRVTSRINEALEMDIPLNKIFDLPTISQYAEHIEQIMMELL